MWIAVALAVGREARHQEARDARARSAPGRGTRRTSAPSRTTCGRRARTRPPAPPPFSGVAGVVFARTSEPPCFSVIAMPQRAPGLSARGSSAAVVRQRREPRLPLGGQLGLRAQRRDGRVGHRDRAAESRLCLREAHERGRPRHVRAGPRLRPGRRSAARSRRPRPSARARPGGTRPRRSGGRSGRGAAASACSRWPRAPSAAPPRSRRSAPTSVRRSRGPLRALALDRLAEHAVGGEDVVALERRRTG